MNKKEEEEEMKKKKVTTRRRRRTEIGVTKEDIEMIARNARRLEKLTSDILDVSRIESNSLKLNLELIDLNEKIRIVVNDERTTIPQGKDLKIIFDQKESGPLFIRGDKSRLFEVLSNLIGNAIKFTE
jgi:signal transduction histidine kinase